MNIPARLRLPFLIVLALLAASSEGRLYRWVDEQGKVHYTDTLPPNQVERGHSEMSEKGLVVDTKGPVKTLEEVQREEELRRVREAAERAKKQQEAADQALLGTFRSVDDMVMARDGKLAAIDVMIRLTRSNIHRQQETLRGLRTDTANLERTGKPIPKKLSDGIGKSEQSIRDAYATVVEREQEKQEIVARFASDMKRYRELKKIPEAKQGSEDKAPSALLKNLVPCPDDETCNRFWETATAYLRKHSTTPVQGSGPNMVITAAPTGPGDIGLTLFRIRDSQGSGSRIFLDVQCRPTPSSDLTCTGPDAQRILDGFRDAVR